MARFTAYYRVISRCSTEIEAEDAREAEMIWNEMDLEVGRDCFDSDFDLTDMELIEA